MTDLGRNGEVQMKIRNGFVSNSSSSSFVLLIDFDYYEATLANDPYLRHVADHLGKSAQVFWKKVMSFSGFSNDNYNWLSEIMMPPFGTREDDYESLGESWDKIENLFAVYSNKKDPEKVFFATIDW
jgi:hypothetical protein